MNKLKKLIIDNNDYNLFYYNSFLNIINEYEKEKPDISIETCKSLIEGVSKLILNILEQEPIHVLDSSKDFQSLFKRAFKVIEDKTENPYIGIVDRLGAVIHLVGEIRNKQGDLAHGRSSLKVQKNREDFSELIIGITEPICVYMIKNLCELSIKKIKYDDYELFNEYLDQIYPIDNNISYSKALFEQSPNIYEMLLSDFLLENE